MDCELESNPRVIIVANDNGVPSKSATATLSVSISDVNDHKPLFSQTFYDVELPEDTPKGRCFLTLKATDDDCGENAVVTYATEDDNDHFEIGQNNGEICLSQELDYERQQSHSLIIVGQDKGGLSTSTLVKIAVTDVNDNVPEFLPTIYMAKVSRNLALNVPILTVKAVDKDDDLKGDLAYAILSGNEDVNFVLGANSGTLYLAKRLGAGARTFRFRVQASDGEGQKSSNEATIVVQVTDEDNIPFNSYQFQFSVPEDVSPYSQIGRIIPDQGLFELTLMDQSVAGYFSLDPSTGIIRSEARLDFESHPQVILNIRAENSQDSYHVQAIINITDVNDNAPEFPFPVVSTTVPEDFPVSSVLYTSLASDADSGSNGKITYALVHNEDSSRFTVDPQTGEIRLRSSLDYEDQPQHRILIEAEDAGQPRLKSLLKLDIIVLDVNDNAPVFDRDQYSFALTETHVKGTPILTIHAQDKDSGSNGRLSYSVTPNPYVAILPNSGVLVLQSPVDRETNPSLELTITATDNGVPARKSTALVSFMVSDKNDKTPRFQRTNYMFNTLENLPIGTMIGSVEAIDDDEGPNGLVEYRFRTPISKFLIESSSGNSCSVFSPRARRVYFLVCCSCTCSCCC